MPSMPYDNPQAQQQAEDSAESLDLLGFLRRRKSFVILFALMGVGIGYLLFNRELPVYRSDALVQVIHKFGDARLGTLIAEKDLTDADFVIRSPRTLEAAYTTYDLGKLPTLQGLSMQDAVSRMASMISTKSMSANVLQVSVTGGNPADIQKIGQAAAEQFVIAQKENYKDASEEMKKLLSRAKDDFNEKLVEAEKDYAKFRDSAKLTTDGANPHRQRAKAAFEKVSEAELEMTELSSRLTQLEEAIGRHGSREAILLLVGKQQEGNAVVGNSVSQGVTSAKSLADIIFPMLVEQATLATELGPDHPKLKQLEMRIQMTREHFKSLAGSDSSKETDAPKDLTTDFLSIYLDSIREEIRILERKKRDFLELANREDVLARELMHEEIEDTNRKNAMDRLAKLFNDTSLQISQFEVNKEMGGITALVLSPSSFGAHVYPVMSRFLGLGGFLGALAGLVLGYLVEMADRSFRKPEDIIREFGVPILGHIPFITEQRLKSVASDAGMDKTAVSVHLPRSRPAEAYRSVRTAICFSAMSGSHKVLQVTSPAAGDGKSTLAINLATSLAQSGKRTVLVEADFRRPKVHKLTGVANEVGFADVLRGELTLPEVVQNTYVPDFFVIPCGKRPKNPAELLAKAEFSAELEKLRDMFDYVIVDTPPVLAVTDPCGVAAQVDGTIVCMRLSRHTRDLGRRTIEQLRDVGATITGVVVNGVEERDAYGYGNYRYSDYRYYYKNYNYKYGQYGSKDGREYYTDEQSSEPAFTVGESSESDKA
ncbi:MAG: polysaccharide biosynthesis tyrosine autokinase [Planctomycetaceae bacterium]|nr:polysaccharide biosynthesis tyrosine autokinase [Planctomycetaceae bacterium]